MASTPRPPIPSKGIHKRLKPLLEWIVLHCYEPGDGSISVMQDPECGLIFANPVAAALRRPWQPYVTKANERKFKVWDGSVNNLSATNAGTEFTCPDDSTQDIYLEANITGSTFPTFVLGSYSIEMAGSTPSDDPPNPTTGQPPATKYLRVARVTAENGRLTSIQHEVLNSLQLVVQAGEYGPDGTSVTRLAFWNSV